MLFRPRKNAEKSLEQPSRSYLDGKHGKTVDKLKRTRSRQDELG